MPIPTGQNTRTISGYAQVLLDYPRWVIEREVDFTDCHHGGRFDTNDSRCTSCRFGVACRWLNVNSAAPSPDDSLPELLGALDAALTYLHSPKRYESPHHRDCPCDTCEWLREAKSFLRLHRHHR